jgi:hypothetical protein
MNFLTDSLSQQLKFNIHIIILKGKAIPVTGREGP